MKRITSVILIFSLTATTFAQTDIDVVTLKNGNIIKGKIIEHVINKHIKIELEGGSIFTFQYSEIESLKIEKKSSRTFGSGNQIVNPSKPTYQHPGPSYQKSKPVKMESLVMGAVGGYTKYPGKGKFLFNLGYLQREKNSYFDNDGELQTYKEIFNGDANPKHFITKTYIRIGYSFLDKMELYITIPYQLSAYEEMNPISDWEEWFNENMPDRSGETGMGDIVLGTNYLIIMNENNRTALGIAYLFATGIAYDKIPESSLYATGSGQTAVELILDSDFRLFANNLISFAVTYTMWNEGTYSTNTLGIGEEISTYKEKNGNGIFYSGQILRKVFFSENGIAMGIGLFGYRVGKSSVDGEEIEESEWNYMKFTPILGYQGLLGESLISLGCSYPININGKNSSNWKSLSIRLEILF